MKKKILVGIIVIIVLFALIVVAVSYKDIRRWLALRGTNCGEVVEGMLPPLGAEPGRIATAQCLKNNFATCSEAYAKVTIENDVSGQPNANIYYQIRKTNGSCQVEVIYANRSAMCTALTEDTEESGDYKRTKLNARGCGNNDQDKIELFEL